MKIMIGLSGGVDSAIAAYLLKKEGHEVVCCFMRNWDAMLNNDNLGNPTINDSICPQEQDYLDAIDVAKRLNLPLLREDYIKEYWDNVFKYFLDEYKKGRTPNPDVFCNKYIKFGPFIKFAKENGCDAIAMGHYAKKIIDENGRAHLYKAFDKTKDQSYFLSQISYDQLSFCLFPLGDITKKEVREIAKELDLKTVEFKKDSTGICFIGERNFKEFLTNYIPAKEGNIVDIETGRILGKHQGVMYYTLGQRKGLGLGGIKDLTSHGFYVCKKDVEKNILYVARDENDIHLFSDKCTLSHLNFFQGEIKNGTHIKVKFRYRQEDKGVTFYTQNNLTYVLYDEPYKAVTPGQICVFYDDNEECLGSGIIEDIFFKGEKKN